MLSNPMLEEFLAINGKPSIDYHRTKLAMTYSWAMPSERAIRTIAIRSPRGVVELGAGTGYWAWMLATMVDIVALDIKLPEAPFPWFLVQKGKEETVATLPERTLLMVYPRGFAWDALSHYEQAGGKCVAIVGENEIVASPAFFSKLEKEWTEADRFDLPSFCGIHDEIRIFVKP